jgi:hypothetical protein
MTEKSPLEKLAIHQPLVQIQVSEIHHLHQTPPQEL